MNSEEILKHWLRNTTCGRFVVKKSILFENSSYIVLKHNSHAEYCGRSMGVINCNSYAKLYRKSDFKDDRYCRVVGYGDGHVLEWCGRISKFKIISDCNAIGIKF